MRPSAATLAELVRLPAVLTVPGDALLGAASSRRRAPAAEVAALTAASSCLYLAGMALNDYADREVDAHERPTRPIPSGRVSPRLALGVATGLTAAGLGAAALAGGRSALRVAAPLAGLVWAYDLVLKRTPVGPAAMAGCRFADVLLGARGDARAALAPASVVGAHTLVVTAVSTREVQGSTSRLARAALAGTVAVSAGAAALTGRAKRGHGRKGALLSVGALAFLGAFGASVGRAELAASRDPSPAALQRVVGTGVLGLMPLEASLLTTAGAPLQGASIGSLWLLAKRLARRRSVT